MWLVYKYKWWPSKYQISGTTQQIEAMVDDLKKKDVEYYRINFEAETLKVY